MMKITRYRFYECETGTLSVTVIKNASFYVLEPPWRDNRQGISCIPPGLYHAVRGPGESNLSAGISDVFRLVDVPDRENIIECHVGNMFVNPNTGKAETQGCALYGTAFGLTPTPRVYSSRMAVQMFFGIVMEGVNVFELDVRGI